MNLQRFDLNLLKSLDALLTEKNVTRAAERVFLSQPAMSGALKRLREELNDQLLVRVGREMVLTSYAETLLVSVREILQTIQDTLETKLNFDPASERRSFNLAMTDYASMVLMPEILERLAQYAPYITCNILSVDENTASGLMGGDIDFFVGVSKWLEDHEKRLGTELCSEPLFSDDFVCVVARDHPDIDDTITYEQYCELPHSVVRFPRQLESLIEGHWRTEGLDLRVGVTAPNFSTLVLMLPNTRLIATVPRKLGVTLSMSLPLKVTECPISMPKLEEILVWHPRASLNPAHEFLRRMIFSSVNTLVGSPDNSSGQ
ncbi:MAG: LysR family transcriptional regulator [Robiginitomaculum sp.]|nr:MAG: LysR family transcriptional regulator [Robiginitomaculum sp.]